MHALLSFLSCFLAAALLLTTPSLPMDTPLSEEAVRDAYFLGQHHDQSLERLPRQVPKVSSRCPKQAQTSPPSAS